MYFQACKEASPIHSGVLNLAMAVVIPAFGLTSGIIIKRTKRYLVVLLVGYSLILIGSGLFTLLKADSAIGKSVGFEIVISSGLGIIVRIGPMSISSYAYANGFSL